MIPGAADARRMRLILELRQMGVTDARVLSAIERTPRAHFAPAHLEALAWDDVALPIERGQTMTKPSLIAQMLLALQVGPGHRVLEIGSGSGFQTAVLARLADRVTSLERIRALADSARERFVEIGAANAQVHWADGADGWKADAPYDRVIVNAASEDFLPVVLDQMAPSALIVAAIGQREQSLKRVRKDEEGRFKVEAIGSVALTALAAGLED